MCNEQTVTTAAKFDNGDPLIIVADLLPNEKKKKESRRTVRHVCLEDLKRVISVGEAKYVRLSSQWCG